MSLTDCSQSAKSLTTRMPNRPRCAWADSTPDYQRYHDDEWGVRETGEIALFERLSLEGFQSGLSWLTILRKRESFRVRFEGFDPERIAKWREREIERALLDAGIVRHRGKIEATVNNARALVRQWQTHGPDWLVAAFDAAAPSEASLEAQGFERPPVALGQLPASTIESKALSKVLKSAGFGFVGPTTVYAALQATGRVNDHVVGCFRR